MPSGYGILVRGPPAQASTPLSLSRSSSSCGSSGGVAVDRLLPRVPGGVPLLRASLGVPPLLRLSPRWSWFDLFRWLARAGDWRCSLLAAPGVDAGAAGAAGSIASLS